MIRVELRPDTKKRFEDFAFKAIAGLIVNHPEDVHSLLLKHGYKPETMEAKELGELANQALYDKPTFRKEFIELLKTKLGAEKVESYYNQVEPLRPTGDAVGGFDPISAVANAISNVFGFLKAGSEGRTQRDLSKDQITMNLINLQGAKERSKRQRILVWGGIGSAILIFGTIAIIAATKARRR